MPPRVETSAWLGAAVAIFAFSATAWGTPPLAQSPPPVGAITLDIPTSTGPALSSLPPMMAEYPPPETRWFTIGAGLATTAIWYGGALGTSYAFPDAPGARDLRVPLIGPWQAVLHNGCSPSEPGCSQTDVVIRSLLSILDGVGQGAGLLIALEGALLPTQREPALTISPTKEAPSSTPAKGTHAPERPERQPTEHPSAPSASPPSSAPQKLFYLPTPTTFGGRGFGAAFVGRF